MESLRCIVIDDDDTSRAIIEKFIEKSEDLELAAAYANPEDAVPSLKSSDVDVVFLDVEMPQMSGLDLIKNLSELPPIVLTTSQKDYAIEAFELDVVDYLLKPFVYARFLKAIEKVRERLERSAAADAPFQDDLFIKINSRYVKLPCSEIRWITAIGDYVEIYTSTRKHTVHTTMKMLERKLPAKYFVRVHRSHIVNVHSITEIEDNTVVVEYRADHKMEKKLLPVGKSFRDNLMKTLNMI
ncbi:MAG: LytTR family DNA-binding domain-containing protein [Bacteroidia bacterium]|nr:LytTR family DNA-binding domain-containing protein [Bacteroidia bacterium]